MLIARPYKMTSIIDAGAASSLADGLGFPEKAYES